MWHGTGRVLRAGERRLDAPGAGRGARRPGGSAPPRSRATAPKRSTTRKTSKATGSRAPACTVRSRPATRSIIAGSRRSAGSSTGPSMKRVTRQPRSKGDDLRADALHRRQLGRDALRPPVDPSTRRRRRAGAGRSPRRRGGRGSSVREPAAQGTASPTGAPRRSLRPSMTSSSSCGTRQADTLPASVSTRLGLRDATIARGTAGRGGRGRRRAGWLVAIGG